MSGTPEQGRATDRAARRLGRWRLLRVLQTFSSIDRCKCCYRSRLPGRVPQVRQKDGTAYYAGLQVCGNQWCCPICGAKIRAARALQISAMMLAWIARGNTCLLLTLTLRHSWDRLADLCDDLSAAMSYTFSGRPWRRARDAYAVRHYARTYDVTHGAAGWHPHFHCVLWVEGPVDDATVQALEDWVWDRWSTWFVRRRAHQPNRRVGIDLRRCGTAQVGAYVAGIKSSAGDPAALEVTRWDMKRGKGSRTPLEILADLGAHGEDRDLRLWRDWERAMKGRRWIQFSRGAQRELLPDPDDADLSDEELAAREIDGEPVLELSAEEWLAVLTVEGRCRLLEIVETLGAEAASRYLLWCMDRAGMEHGLRPP